MKLKLIMVHLKLLAENMYIKWIMHKWNWSKKFEWIVTRSAWTSNSWICQSFTLFFFFWMNENKGNWREKFFLNIAAEKWPSLIFIFMRVLLLWTLQIPHWKNEDFSILSFAFLLFYLLPTIAIFFIFFIFYFNLFCMN